MDAWVWVLIAIGILVATWLVWMVVQRKRTGSLKERFGPEYDRTVRVLDDRREAESELRARQERRAKLQIRPLPAEARERYAQDWRVVQTRFVDDPNRSFEEADGLVRAVMKDRGYPMEDFEQRVADVSVDHPLVVEHYRQAHAMALANERGAATTEDLRQGMVHYRTLFDELLRTDEGSRVADAGVGPRDGMNTSDRSDESQRMADR